MCARAVTAFKSEKPEGTRSPVNQAHCKETTTVRGAISCTDEFESDFHITNGRFIHMNAAAATIDPLPL